MHEFLNHNCLAFTTINCPKLFKLEALRQQVLKITLSDPTISALEEVSEKKITRNGDQIIREIAEMAKKASENGSEKEIKVCDFTNKMAEEKN